MWYFAAIVKDESGAEYQDSYFIDDYDKGFDMRWQYIYETMRTHLSPFNPLDFGYGGDDVNGSVLLDNPVDIPDMKFTILEKEYIMHFGKAVEIDIDCMGS